MNLASTLTDEHKTHSIMRKIGFSFQLKRGSVVASLLATMLFSNLLNAQESCVYSVPFTEGFENWQTGDNAPAADCWTKMTNHTHFTGRPGVSDYFTPHSGSKSIMMTSYGLFYTALVLPPVDVPVDSLQINFWMRKRNQSDSPHPIYIGAIVDSFNTFTIIDSVYASNYEWSFYEVPLDAYSGNATRIAIVAPEGHNGQSLIDDIEVDRIPSCRHPQGLTVDSVTGNSIYVHWDDDSTQIAWIVNCGDMQSLTTYNSFYWEGLEMQSNYTVTVRKLCDWYDTSSAVTVNVRTGCGMLTTLPYSTDFDSVQQTGYSSEEYEDCWQRNRNFSDNFPFCVEKDSDYPNATSHSGNQHLHMHIASDLNGNTGHKAWTTLPPIDTNDLSINEMKLTFWARRVNNVNIPLQIGTMSHPDSVDSFVGIDTVTINQSTYSFYEVPMNRYVGNATYIALKMDKSYWAFDILLDDLTLDYMPQCPAVTNVAAVLEDKNAITITWHEVGDATSWSVEYGPHGFTPGTGSIDTAYSKPYTVSGLNANMQYDFIVKPVCNYPVDGVSGTFSTTQDYLDLPFAETFGDIDTASARWTFLNSSGNNQWVVGSLLGTGDNSSMYVSNDNGTSYGYDITSASLSMAYVDVMLRDSADYYYSYEYICQAADWMNDYMRVALAPASVDLQTVNSGIGPGTLPSGWKDLGSSFPEASDWTNVSGTLHNIAPGVYHLVVIWKNNNATDGGKPGAIDNIYLQKKSCYKAGSLQVLNVGSDSIQVYWTKEYGVADSLLEQSLWQVVWDDGSDTVTCPYFKYTIHNLTPATRYNIKVRMICGDGDTGMYTTLFATTQCGIMPIPYSEDFDNIHGYTSADVKDIYIPCWGEYQIGNTSSGYAAMPYVGYQTEGSHSGDYALCIERNAYVVLPEFDVPLDSLEMSFWLHGNGVTICILENAVSQSYTAIEYIPWSQFYEYHTVRFDNYSGSGHRIAIKAQGVGSTSCYNWIDDLTVNYRQYCLPVTDLQVDSLNVNEAAISWNDSIASQWIVEYGAEGHLPGEGSDEVAVVPHRLLAWPNNLDTFDVYVRPVCSIGDTGDWTGPLTITKPTCDAIDSIYNIESDEFTVSFDIMESSSTSLFEARLSKTADTTILLDTILQQPSDMLPHYTLTNLDPGEEYLLCVRRLCDGRFTSEWYCITFSTLPVACSTPTDLIVENISSNGATFDWDADENTSLWELHVWNTVYDTVMTVIQKPVTLDGLAVDVSYNAAVRTLCYDGQYASEYSDTVTFITSACAIPTAVTATAVTGHSATITWNGSTERYILEYGTGHFAVGSGTRIEGLTTNSFTITNLQLNTNYEALVRALCSDGTISAWSERVAFTTATTGIDDNSQFAVQNSKISVYPNPASHQVTVEIEDANEMVEVKILDLSGRQVYANKLDYKGTNTRNIDLTGIPQGAYFINITSPKHHIVRKLVIR